MARHLEQLGHDVIVADPNFAPMYATRSRRTKTDRRDARTLMEACRLGAYRPAYRLSDARRHVRAELAVREALVRTRTRYIALAKAFVRRDGLRVASGEAHLVSKRIAALDLSESLRAELVPLFQILGPINEQIAAADRRIAAVADADPAMALLAAPIGPITASAIVATVDDVARFRSAHQFEAFLGLVPGERSSARSGGWGASRRRATRACGVSAPSRPDGAFSARRVTRPRRCARGRWRLPCAAANGSLLSRWRAAWPGLPMRCGATAARTMRPSSACRGRERWRCSERRLDRERSR